MVLVSGQMMAIKILSLLLGIAMFTTVAACADDDGPAENLGEQIDDAVEDARGRLEEAADEAREAAEEVGDALRDN